MANARASAWEGQVQKRTECRLELRNEADAEVAAQQAATVSEGSWRPSSLWYKLIFGSRRCEKITRLGNFVGQKQTGVVVMQPNLQRP